MLQGWGGKTCGLYAISGRNSRHIGTGDRIVCTFQTKHYFGYRQQQQQYLRHVRKLCTYAHSTAPKTRRTKLLYDKHPFLIVSILLVECARFLSSSHATSSATPASSVFCYHCTMSISVTVTSLTFNMIFVAQTDRVPVVSNMWIILHRLKIIHFIFAMILCIIYVWIWYKNSVRKA